MQQKLFNDRPYIVLNYPDVIDAYDGKKWAGFYNEPGFGILFPEQRHAEPDTSAPD